MKLNLNKKGYMLVEIIIAFSIAFVIMYFMMNLVITLKSKNDDLLVKTLVVTDQAIVTNELVEIIANEKETFDCNMLKVENNKVLYKNQTINVISDYANSGDLSCEKENNKVSIKIPLDVKQINNENFDVVIDYLYSLDPVVVYAVYSNTDNSLRFYNNSDNPQVGEVYKDRVVSAIYTDFLNVSVPPWTDIKESVRNVIVEEEISTKNTRVWFNEFRNCSKFDLKKLDTSMVTNMEGMFLYAGYNINTGIFNIEGISDWDVSNVTNMSQMFVYAGANTPSFNLDLSKWDVSNVTNMQGMFNRAGWRAYDWSIGDISKWDTSKLKNFRRVFSMIVNVRDFNLGDLSTKVVTRDDGSTYTAWDVSNVTDMGWLFNRVGENYGTNFYIGDLSKWDVSNVKNMEAMFQGIGSYSLTGTVDIGDLSTKEVTVGDKTYTAWDVSNVTDMGYFGGDLDYDGNPDVGGMFSWTLFSRGRFLIGDISNWNTSNVTDMGAMFYASGVNRGSILDLSDWNVDKVTVHDAFNEYYTNQVISPQWK